MAYTKKYTKKESKKRMAKILGFRNYKEYKRDIDLALNPYKKYRKKLKGGK